MTDNILQSSFRFRVVDGKLRYAYADQELSKGAPDVREIAFCPESEVIIDQLRGTVEMRHVRVAFAESKQTAKAGG